MGKYILLVMLSCMSFFNATAQEIVIVDNIKNYIENGKATIMVQDESLSGNIIVPEYVSKDNINYKVTAATNGAFSGTDITGIVLPNTITSLGDQCFYYCHKLASIALPNGLTSLGDECFYGCSGLTSITLSNGITTLGSYCFYACYSLTSITIPNNITTLGDGCFSECI